MTAPSITDFILARVAEWERTAKDILSRPLGDVYEHPWHSQDWAEIDADVLVHVDEHSPARVLRLSAAIRAIVAESGVFEYGGPGRYLASIWRDHPDYRQEWDA